MPTNTYRAITSYSNSSTGEIRVRIPAKFGPETTIDISRIGRTAYNGSWPVPAIGEQIVVTADDEEFTNAFWIQTNPTSPTSLTEVNSSLTEINSSLTEVNSSLTEINSSLTEVNSSLTEVNSFLDALALGIFS